jgi:hypothetical protein
VKLQNDPRLQRAINSKYVSNLRKVVGQCLDSNSRAICREWALAKIEEAKRLLRAIVVGQSSMAILVLEIGLTGTFTAASGVETMPVSLPRGFGLAHRAHR